MDARGAGFWLNAIAAVAAMAWIVGALFVARTVARLGHPPTGSIDVEGTPAVLAQRAAAALARGEPVPPLQQLRIESAQGDRVIWVGQWPPARHRGELQLAPLGQGRTRVSWQIEATAPRLLMARIWVGVGAVAILALYFFLLEFVLVRDNPGVRGQVMQMVQAVHVLWPPFLFCGLARLMWRKLDAAVARVVQNLPFESGR